MLFEGYLLSRSPFYILLNLPNQPESHTAVSSDGITAYPICCTAAICIHEPATAPHDPTFSGIRTGRIGLWLGGVVCIPVLTPLLDIAMHVIESPCIRQFLANPVGLFARIIDIPCFCIQIDYHIF